MRNDQIYFIYILKTQTTRVLLTTIKIVVVHNTMKHNSTVLLIYTYIYMLFLNTVLITHQVIRFKISSLFTEEKQQLWPQPPFFFWIDTFDNSSIFSDLWNVSYLTYCILPAAFLLLSLFYSFTIHILLSTFFRLLQLNSASIWFSSLPHPFRCSLVRDTSCLSSCWKHPLQQHHSNNLHLY